MRALLPLILLPGCATFAFPGSHAPFGSLYSDASAPQAVTHNAIGKKKGEACATSILGLVTTGEAGIREAADAGGITYISAVDSTFTNILGVWSKYCTVVSGDDQAPGVPVEAAPPAEPAPAEAPAPPAEPAPAPAPAAPKPTPPKPR